MVICLKVPKQTSLLIKIIALCFQYFVDLHCWHGTECVTTEDHCHQSWTKFELVATVLLSSGY